MNYCPNTGHEISGMLSDIGIGSIEELFSRIPGDIRTKKFEIPAGKTEPEVLNLLKKYAGQNAINLHSFLGGGAYDHYIPAAVDSLAGRSEFSTAYTPYQGECSQGTLQALFEYQTAMCSITGMDVSNASLYDGASALSEAALMAIRATGRSVIRIDNGVNPFYSRVLKTYLHGRPVTNDMKPDKDTAALIVQNPDFFGNIRDYSKLSHDAHQAGALLIMSVYPVSLGILKKPSEMDADIATGDGQSLGIPLSFGGPSFGFITSKKGLIRNIPGRIVGETTDRNGVRGYVLTLQAREQHIRRQKATSNICSNQSLCALRAVIFLSLLGKEGFRELAELNYSKSEFLKGLVTNIKDVKIFNSSPTFNEFTIELPAGAEAVEKKMREKGYLAGLPLGKLYPDNPGMGKMLLTAVTENRTREEMEGFAACLEESL
jgi:glycine dehydrogenase subunit 1